MIGDRIIVKLTPFEKFESYSADIDFYRFWIFLRWSVRLGADTEDKLLSGIENYKKMYEQGILIPHWATIPETIKAKIKKLWK